MAHESKDAFDALRDLTTELLSSIEAWSDRLADPRDFRHRLVRAHALALMDELEQLSVSRTVTTASRASPETNAAR